VAARVTSAREVEGRWLVTFEGTTTREAAAALAGSRVAIEAAASPPLPEGRWYVRDLVGRQVVAEDGRVLGAVTDVVRTGANDCWEISGPDGDLLFPALRALVVQVPPAPGVITVRVPPGLLEACLKKRKS
jgi:16S rRNA processing protein RimM